MLPLGHMGITVAVIRVLESKFQLSGIDYRLLLVASLLPDLIDKPISYLFGAYPIVNGIHYGHSVLFLLIISIIAIFQWYWWNNSRGAIIWSGVVSHDILDLISHHAEWVNKKLFNINILLEWEIIGVCILLYFLVCLVLPSKVQRFIKTGEL